MATTKRYPFSVVEDDRGKALARPMLPLRLSHKEQSIETPALLDTGATVNVLPYEIGESLGLQWSELARPVSLTGNLANYDARGVLLTAHVGEFPLVDLVFAWTKAQRIPILLGQVNFFAEFDVCFFSSRGLFELQLKSQ